jgi:hypothetical protein
MKPCGFAGGNCPHEAVVTVRIAGIGDRAVCQGHHDWMVAHAMDFRVLDPNAYKPEWLANKTFARDLTGRVLA